MKINKWRKRIDIVNRYKEFIEHKMDEDDVFVLLNFMFGLTPSWFEQYIRDYFDKKWDFNRITVTWWINDKGIDVRGEKKNNEKVLIQCKKFIKSHVTEKDVLLFIEQTKEYKKRLWDTLSLFFITTNWVNRQARERAKKNWITIYYYKDILKMNESLNIEAYIKEHKNNKKICSNIDFRKILDVYYHKKALWNILWDITYFIETKIVNKLFKPYYLDYQKVEKLKPEETTTEKLLRKSLSL